MDMKKIALFMTVAFALFSCVKPDERVRDASTELRSLKAFVYYDESNLSKYEEVDLLSGMYIEEKGLASYTFPDDAEKFNESSLKNAEWKPVSHRRQDSFLPTKTVMKRVVD